MRLDLGFFGESLTTSRSPSSMREVNVRCSASALRLARLSNSFGSLTVVRSIICQDIPLDMSICQGWRWEDRRRTTEDGTQGESRRDEQYIFRCPSSVVRPLSSAPKRKPGPCGPGLVRRRGGVDDSPSRGEHLPALQSPIWEDEATACLQHTNSMRGAMRAHNAVGDMPAMRSSQGA